jgi:hypothetical protein
MSDKSVERPLKLEVGYLSLFKMQPSLGTLPWTRVATNCGVCGGVSWSSNASLCAFVVVRSDT